MRAIAILLALILSGSTFAPAVTLAADGRGWQGWAFEIRNDAVRGWVGSWTPGACEALRRDALEEKLDAAIGTCHPMTLTEEPSGILVWVVLVGDSHFVAASRSDIICDEEDETPDTTIRPVAMVSRVCQRLWIRGAV